MKIDLQGQMAHVFGTGSSRPGWGNGKTVALTYARADLNLAAAKEAAGIITADGGKALFLAADLADYAKGAEIVVDGGLFCKTG